MLSRAIRPPYLNMSFTSTQPVPATTGHGHGAGGSGESVGGRGSDDGGQGYHIDVAHSQGDGGGDGIEHGGAHGVGGEVGCDDAQGGDDQDEDGLVHPGDQGGDVADKEVGDAHLLQRQGAADDQDGGIEDQGAPGHAAGRPRPYNP